MEVKICERVLCIITFTCKWFLTFQCFILKLNKKVQSPRVPNFGVLGPRSLVLGSRVLGPVSWVSVLGSWVPGLGSWVVCPRALWSRDPGPGSRVLGFWVLILDDAALNICSKLIREHPCRSVISIKLQRNFIEIKLRHRCSPVNLLHIFRKPFHNNTSGGLFLKWRLLQLCNISLKGWEGHQYEAEETSIEFPHSIQKRIMKNALVELKESYWPKLRNPVAVVSRCYSK